MGKQILMSSTNVGKGIYYNRGRLGGAGNIIDVRGRGLSPPDFLVP